MLNKLKKWLKKKIKPGGFAFTFLGKTYKIVQFGPGCLYKFIRSQYLFVKLFGPQYPRRGSLSLY